MRHLINWRIPRSGLWAPLLGGLLLASTSVGHAQSASITPKVPANIAVPEGNTLFRVTHAVGTQNYVCLPSGSDFKFVLYTPQATLFDEDSRQVGTHYFSPNPDEGGVIRATWQDSDTSAVWGQAKESSVDTNYIAPDAIAWVLLQRVGAQGDDSLSRTTYVQRLNTSGGVAPGDSCRSSEDVGTQAFVPYTADYFFYSKAS